MDFKKFFLEELSEILDHTDYYDIIRWNSDEQSFSIIDRARLVSEILPKHFKQSQYKSFTKQLNTYSFKSSKIDGITIYDNPSFTKSTKLIQNISKSKRQKKQKKSEQLFDSDHEDICKKQSKLLELQLFEILNQQKLLLEAFKKQIFIQNCLYKIIQGLKFKVERRREAGLQRRQQTRDCLQAIFGGFGMSRIAYKFLTLNHEVLCDCQNQVDNPEEPIPSDYYLSPQAQCKRFPQLNSLRKIYIKEKLLQQPFFTMSEEEQKDFIETIWKQD